VTGQKIALRDIIKSEARVNEDKKGRKNTAVNIFTVKQIRKGMGTK
jgi:hypothetical protein